MSGSDMMYSSSILRAIRGCMRRLIEKILQAWLADDAAAAGTLEALLQWYDHLVIEGVRFGYFVNGKKSWLIVKTQEAKERAEKIFGDRVNITTEGQRHLGAVLGSKSFKDQYCGEMVEKWITDLKALCEIARSLTSNGPSPPLSSTLNHYKM